MQLIKDLFSVNEILTVSLLGWFVAQVLKTIINFILLGKFQLERMWGDGGMPSAHSAMMERNCIAARDMSRQSFFRSMFFGFTMRYPPRGRDARMFQSTRCRRSSRCG